MSQLSKERTLYLTTLSELILANMMFFIFLFGHHLPDHQSSDVISVFYWLELFQESSIILFLGTTLLIVAFLTALLSLFFGILSSSPGKMLLANILSVVAWMMTFLSIFPHFFVGYEHLMSRKINHNQFILGLRTAMDGDNFYIVGKCDRWLFRCEAYALTDVEVPSEGERIIVLEPGKYSNLLNVILQFSNPVEEVTIPTKLMISP